MDGSRLLSRLPLAIERLFPDTPFHKMKPTDGGTMSQVRGTNPDLYTNVKRKPAKKGGKKGC